jgi:hypothetical protein
LIADNFFLMCAISRRTLASASGFSAGSGLGRAALALPSRLRGLLGGGLLIEALAQLVEHPGVDLGVMLGEEACIGIAGEVVGAVVLFASKRATAPDISPPYVNSEIKNFTMEGWEHVGMWGCLFSPGDISGAVCVAGGLIVLPQAVNRVFVVLGT